MPPAPRTPATGLASDDPGAVAARLRLAATRLARRLRQQADSGLSPSQLSALAAVERHGPLTLGALSGRERVAPPTVTKVVAKLEEEGLVARERDPADRRVSRVAITGAGRELIHQSRRRKDAFLSSRLAGLTPEERRRLADALDVLEALVDDVVDDSDGPGDGERR